MHKFDFQSAVTTCKILKDILNVDLVSQTCMVFTIIESKRNYKGNIFQQLVSSVLVDGIHRRSDGNPGPMHIPGQH